jgi:hypothetical protein
VALDCDGACGRSHVRQRALNSDDVDDETILAGLTKSQWCSLGSQCDTRVVLADAIVIGFIVVATIGGTAGLFLQWYRAGHRNRFLPW